MSKVLVISGTHGNETHAVDLVYDLECWTEKNGLSKIEREAIGKNVQFIHAWNKTGLKYNERNFIDESKDRETMDLNRSFHTDGVYTKEGLVENLKAEIGSADIVIDVHNSPACANCILINNGPHARTYVDFCKKYDLQYIVRESSADTIKQYAIDQGKVAFTVEIGDMGISDKDDDLQFLIKLLKALLLEEPFFDFSYKDVDSFSASEVYTLLYSHADGLIRGGDQKPLKRKDLFKRYKKGDYMFTIIDPTERKVKEYISAPCDCWLVDFEDNVWAAEGGTIGAIQPIIGWGGEDVK